MRSSTDRRATLGSLLAICVFLTLLLLPKLSLADSVGVSYDQQGYVQNGQIYYPDQGVSDLRALSYSNGFSLTGTDGSISIIRSDLDPKNTNVALRSFGRISQNNRSSQAAANLYLGDAFHVLGPTGQNGNLLISVVLDSTITVSGRAALSNATMDLIENGTYNGFGDYFGTTLAEIGNSGANPHARILFNLPVASGSTFTLAEFLAIRLANANSATVNASDTAYMTIISTTPGFSFTTESGLTYANAPVAPATAEPPPSVLFALGIVLLVGSRVFFVHMPIRQSRQFECELPVHS